MTYFKFLFIMIILFISSCSESVQNNGLSFTKVNQIKINIGETSKNDLSNLYGPPVFESIFNKGVIYYVSHKSSYQNFNPRTTKQLVVLEITLDKMDIVKNVKKYSENDTINVNVLDTDMSNDGDKVIFWKQILNNMKRKQVE